MGILEYCFAIFLIILGHLILKDSTMKLRWGVVINFIGFMVIASFLRLAILDFASTFHPADFQDILDNVTFMTLPFVFLEDALIALGPLIVYSLINSSSFSQPVRWVLLSIAVFCHIWILAWFSLGHMYQGTWGACFSVLYALISFRYIQRFGFWTVGLCHVLYDFFSLITIYIWMIVKILESV